MRILTIHLENVQQQNPAFPLQAAGHSKAHLAEVTTNENPGAIAEATVGILADVQELSTGEKKKVYTPLHIYANCGSNIKNENSVYYNN